MEEGEPGDEFSVLLLSMFNHFRNGSSPSEVVKKRTLSRIGGATAAIGCVADPGFDEASEQLVAEIADLMHGVVFNGWAILAADGTVLLEREGG